MSKLVGFLLLQWLLASSYAVSNKTFPEDFMFGTATASYQVEGGWNADGKGENIWDHITHNQPWYVLNQDNGDVACDSYNKYKEDVAILKDLGVAHYRFSLSWSRILPTGFTNDVNEAGVNYYKNLIKELKDNNIEPLITLFHWDTPQPIEDAGGWLSENIVDWYGDYANLSFELFGDSVKYWLTFNEPKQTCLGGYGSGDKAPGINSSGVGDYICTHNLLKAHARAWHIYDEQYRSKQNGFVGITVDSTWFEPATNSTEDATAAETALQFTYGWYVNPVVNGDYPAVMRSQIDERSRLQGYGRSRLPEFTTEEKLQLQGTLDYLGVNFYTSTLTKPFVYDIENKGYYNDAGVTTYQPEDWESSASPWLKVTPWGIRKFLKWIKDTYNSPRMIITENGISDDGSTLADEQRTRFYRDYLSNVRDAMDIDGADVFGYTAWSLMDNFEWRAGYSQKFGLYQVDFNSPNRTRTPKDSAAYYKKVISTRCLVETCE